MNGTLNSAAHSVDHKSKIRGTSPARWHSARMVQLSRGFLSLLPFCLISQPTSLWSWTFPNHSRRSFIAATFAAPSAFVLSPDAWSAAPIDPARSGTDDSTGPTSSFRTLGYGQEEYTNSITASRDTNISPREAYDVIRERIPLAASPSPGPWRRSQRVLDVGAGAGVSTQVLFSELGYTDIDAVDWSADAWDTNVVACPASVRFFALSDDAFFARQRQRQQLQLQSTSQLQQDSALTEAFSTQYSVICYNFAINFRKAERVAQQHLTEDGILLAPINDKADYWYKQSYYILNSQGRVVWKSQPEVGAWSVQFQPDVTAETCTGIWCGGFNGYRSN